MPPEVRRGGRVELPNRNDFLYSGEIDQALAFSTSQRQSANLWWPEDRTRCVATGLDLNWTYLGGSDQLVELLLADPRLEALPVELGDPCTSALTPSYRAIVARAALTLRDQGSVSIATTLGTIEARLAAHRPGATLRIERKAVSGSVYGSSNGAVDPANIDRLGQRLGFSLGELTDYT